jgi:hypothetical protein
MQHPDDIEKLISAWDRAPKRVRKLMFLKYKFYVWQDEISMLLTRISQVWKFIERRKAPQVHWVGDRRRVPRPEGLFPELAARSLVLIISGCVTWVTAWAVYFASQGWREGLIMIPLFVAWVLFVLFFRGVKLRMNGVVQ